MARSVKIEPFFHLYKKSSLSLNWLERSIIVHMMVKNASQGVIITLLLVVQASVYG